MPATVSLAAPVRSFRSTIVLAIILTVQLMVVLDATIVNIALPHIKEAMHFSAPSLSWVINAYTLSFGGLLLLGARCGDLLGRRTTFFAGLALFTAASLAGGLATSGAWLLSARAAQGVGAALAAPSALAFLMLEFPDPRGRTRAIGWYTAVSIGGSAVGLIAGGMLTQWVSWRWVLFVNVPIGIAALVAGRTILPETGRQSGRFDVAGALTSTIGVAAVVYGFVRAATAGWSGPSTMGAFAAGVILLAAFVMIERRAQEPITPLGLFADRNRSTSYLARLFLVAGMYGMFFFLTQFLQDILGYSPVRAGLAFLPLTAMLFAGSQFSARVLMPRFPQKALVVCSLSLSTVGLALLTGLSAHSSYISMLIPILLFGLGNGLAFVPLTAASLAGVRPADAGAASGLVNVMQQVGGSLGLAVLVSVFGAASRAAGRAGARPATALARAHHEFIAGADHAFVVAAIFLAATVLLTLIALERAPRSGGQASEENPQAADAALLEASVA